MQAIRPNLQLLRLMSVIIANVIISPMNADNLDTDLEYRVKAGFLGNFAKFVRWPTAFLPKADSPYVIGILGEDPFGSVIDQAIDGFTIGGKNVVIKRFNDVASLEFCHILFISRSQKVHLDHIFTSLQRVPTLTVGEMSNFCQKGGMINFIFIENNIRFEVNSNAAQKAQLKLSSNLLSLAKAIY